MNFQGCRLELLGHFLDTTLYSCHHIHQDMFYVLFVSFWHRPPYDPPSEMDSAKLQ